MKYKAICALDKITQNGKKYLKGDFVMNVEVTEIEAKKNNKNVTVTGLKFVAISKKGEKDPELEQARKDYLEKFGNKPNHLLKLETLIDKLK